MSGTDLTDERVESIVDQLTSEDVRSWIQEWLPTQGDVYLELPRVELSLAFSDIVASSKLLFELGDDVWYEVQQKHFENAKLFIEKQSGRLVDTAGDGVFAVFPSAQHAFEFATQFAREPGDSRIGIRVGIHRGEIIAIKDRGVCGRAVHIASRVMSHAMAPGEIWLSDEAMQSLGPYLYPDYVFDDFPNCVLKNIPGLWTLWRCRSAAAIAAKSPGFWASLQQMFR